MQFKTQLLVLIVLLFAVSRGQADTAQPTIPTIGAPDGESIAVCQAALDNTEDAGIDYFRYFDVVSCQTQLVNGRNYIITLQSNADSEDTIGIGKCNLTIYGTFGGDFTIGDNNTGEDNCIVRLSAAQGSVIVEPVHPTPVVEPTPVVHPTPVVENNPVV